MATQLTISCNEYPWHSFLRREGRDLRQEVDHVLADVAYLGFQGYEPSVSSVAQLHDLAQRLATYGLTLPSIYVNSHLHDPATVAANMADLLAIGEAATNTGTHIIVTNPSPLRWGGQEDKDDMQLATQAAALNELGEALRKLGITLAYHNHDSELRHAAREFHHMLLATDPANVALCLDAHWIYRGAGNSQIALFDIVELYGQRVVELHLRQSQSGVWSEAFGLGDIDYPRLVATLDARGIHPLLVLEQAVEPVSPHILDAVAAHRHGIAYVRQLFGG